MTIEEKLKEYILERYKSIREFTQVVDMSYSTIDSILRRGIGNSSVSNIIKICKVLSISVDALADGEIVPVNAYKKAEPRIFEVNEILADVKEQLAHFDGLTIDGKPANKESINTIIQAMDIGEAMAKKQ
jgi:transcriptional regulator with XRE-family HTH domain